MKIITTPNMVNCLKKHLTPSTRWCYMGKGVAIRKKIADILGEEKRFYLKGRLSRIAEDLRGAFLDFMANVGKRQKDPLSWWAGKFASRSPFQTDFFLLMCYKRLVLDLANEIDDIIIVIEDPWLYEDIASACINKGICLLGKTNLFLNKIAYLIRAAYSRMRLLTWLLAGRLSIARHRKSGRPMAAGSKTDGSVTSILSYAETRAFHVGKFKDNYMPGLSDLFEKNGMSYFYVYFFPFPLSTAKHIGKNRTILWPLINDIGFPCFLKMLLKIWQPDLDKPILAGMDASILIQREWWMEFSCADFNLNLIIFDALNRFFGKRWCDSVVYVFENQPWEKMLCIAAARNGVKTVGYQHASISRFYLSQFLGRGEESFMPLPDRLITGSGYFASLYKEGKIPADKIVIGGAWRFLHLLQRAENNQTSYKLGRTKPVTLIALSIDEAVSRSMLDQVFKFEHKNRLSDKVELWIKPHPNISLKQLGVEEDKLPPRYVVAKEPFGELMRHADVVIEAASTAGIEAFLCGKKVVSYIPDNLIAIDPLLDMTDARICKWCEGEELEAGFFTEQLSRQKVEKTEVKKYFDDIYHDVWLNMLK